jgi:HK97 gp10 family phage protein
LELEIVVDTTPLDAIIAALPEADTLVAEAASQQVEAGAQSRAPVRTGALRGSIARRVEGARWAVGAGVDYALFVELGTSRMAARPYLRPALEAVNWAGLVRAVSRSIGL